MNQINWGQAVLNNIGFGADGQSNGQIVTNLLDENSAFLVAEDNSLLVIEQTSASNGFGAVYDYSWNGETLLER
jgi:hypothetical protein